MQHNLFWVGFGAVGAAAFHDAMTHCSTSSTSSGIWCLRFNNDGRDIREELRSAIATSAEKSLPVKTRAQNDSRSVKFVAERNCE